MLRKIVDDFCCSVDKIVPYSQLLDYISKKSWGIVSKQAFKAWIYKNSPTAADRLNFGD